jgi:hypothetical protein
MSDGDDIVTGRSNPIAHLDGNAAAGALAELFTTDLTASLGRCDNCGAVRSIAETVVYRDAPGLVVRCPSCDSVLLRLVERPDCYWLDVHGLSYLQIEKTPAQR